MGCPRLAEEDCSAEDVGERNPPRDGVKTGVGMEGGMSSKSNRRSKFDSVGLGEVFTAGFDALEVFISSSELDVSDSVSGLLGLATFLPVVLIEGTFVVLFLTGLVTCLTCSGSESDDSSSLLLLESDSESELELDSVFAPDLWPGSSES